MAVGSMTPYVTHNCAQTLDADAKKQARTNIGANVVYFEYNVATFADIKAAYEAGQTVMVTYTISATDTYVMQLTYTSPTRFIFSNTIVESGTVDIYSAHVNDSNTWVLYTKSIS